MKRRNKNACKIGNGESIIAVVYLSRNYKVACPTASVLAQSDQESPLMRRFHSFPAHKRNKYEYILLWVHAMSSRIYIILWYVYTLKTANSYYTICILFYRVIILPWSGQYHTCYNAFLSIKGVFLNNCLLVHYCFIKKH